MCHTVEEMAAAAGGAGGEAAANAEDDVNVALDNPLLAPSVRYVIPKTREGAFVRDNTGITIKTFRVTNPEKCRKYIQQRILFDGAIAGAPIGVYTWILKDMKGLGRHLAAIRTLTRQEVGTLHKNLDQFTREGTVRIAGELRIIEDETGEKKFLFNKLSGSYTKNLADQDARMEELKEYATSVGINPNEYVGDEKIINAEPNESLILPTYNLGKYKTFCSMENFVKPNKAEAAAAAQPPKRQRVGGEYSGDGTAASGGGGGGGGAKPYMGGGAWRSRKSRKSRRSANRKSRKSRRTLKHGR